MVSQHGQLAGVLGETGGVLDQERDPVSLHRPQPIVSEHGRYEARQDRFAFGRTPVFVAKKERATQQFAGPLLRRVGAVFVERYDIAGGLADAENIGTLARERRLLETFEADQG